MTNTTHNFCGHKAHISLPIMPLVAIEPNIATKCVVLRKQVVLRSNPVVTPILGCNMAFLVAIWINCIYVWSLTGGCIWNGAISSCILLDMVLQYGGFAMHIKKLTQPQYGCKHGYCDQQNRCISYCCNERRDCNMIVLPLMNLS